MLQWLASLVKKPSRRIAIRLTEDGFQHDSGVEVRWSEVRKVEAFRFGFRPHERELAGVSDLASFAIYVNGWANWLCVCGPSGFPEFVAQMEAVLPGCSQEWKHWPTEPKEYLDTVVWTRERTAHDGLLEEIEENPNDDHLRLVYADWLEERGDRRAEHIRSCRGLLKPWRWAADCAETLERELRRQVGRRHRLHGKLAVALARRTDIDQVLFAVEDAAAPFAIAGLDWQDEGPKLSDWQPATQVYATLGEWFHRCVEPDHQKWCQQEASRLAEESSEPRPDAQRADAERSN